MRRARVNPYVTGLVTVGVCAVMVIAVVLSGLPEGPALPFLSRGVQIKVALADADALQPRAAVQIAGVKIGEVKSVALAPGNTAIATMQIEPKYADIHSDAIAKLRPHGLFGPKFLDLVPGTQAAPLLHDGDTIPAAHTVQPVDLDQVLQELQHDERVNLQTTIVELGKAAAGRGDDVNHLFLASRSLTSVIDSPVLALDSVRSNLSDAIVKDEAFNAEFAKTPLDQLIANNNKVLAAFAANSDHVQSILVHANSTLDSLGQTLTGHIQDLRATIEQLPATIDRLNKFNDLLSVLGANLTGKEPGSSDVTSGIIGAIENVRSAFSGSNPCTPGQGTCPADGRSHYVRVQTFNVSPIGNPLGAICSAPGNLPALGGVLKGVVNCPASAQTAPTPPQLTSTGFGDGTSATVAVLSNLLGT